MSRWERAAAALTPHDSATTTSTHADENRFRFDRLVPPAEVLIAIGCVMVVVGGTPASSPTSR